MAKKKKPANSTSTKSARQKPAAKTKATASSNGTAGKTPAKQTTPRFDGEQIGRTAGVVWGVLSETHETTLTALKKEIDLPGDLVAAAVGWLAREEKLAFVSSGRGVKISLK